MAILSFFLLLKGSSPLVLINNAFPYLKKSVIFHSNFKSNNQYFIFSILNASLKMNLSIRKTPACLLEQVVYFPFTSKSLVICCGK